ncbi:uncharacterized protein KY384_008620 [Bacidia gigantensis]|uniref:uncharacterized protein n=1 Tax=Bacidia gigantensis TaxID=2732470 RepID=UPI001D0475D5|nr:uncharacterized protein KY384_008620 [Bacidia gigantensis]KAG8527190.1 hypothetical protein KY384_008620 [Bacidia gigantensis]
MAQPQPHVPHPKPSMESLTSQPPAQKEKRRRDRKDRPCDACRRRKSKCVINEGQTVCAACAMHGQKCTYVEDPRPRKRRVDTEGQPEGAKRRAPTSNDSKGATATVKIKREGSDGSSSSTASPGNWHYHGSHVGYTTELEPMLFDLSRGAGSAPWSANYQKSDDRNAFLTFGDEDQISPQLTATQTVEKLVGSNGPLLLQHFQNNISRSFPIVEAASLSSGQRKSIDPALLCAIYTVSASSPGFTPDRKRPLDVYQLEDLSLNLINDSLNKATLSTIQAGLLLMQRSDFESKTLNTQLVSATFELGLHLDCSSWTLSEEEIGLRKRLAWAMYMQDVWCSLVHGRPALISKAHWAVKDLYDEDFGSQDDSRDAIIEERKRGLECFCQMVTLTQILSNILDTFYTQRAIQDYDDAGENGTRLILERAKPIQMKLKDWFTQLPKTLKLDNGEATSMIGHLHLAYFATEITLHRCIIRSLANCGGDNYLTFICRGAAKSRLISAMDFVNRLRSDHLTSFWYFPSKVNFALVATFGSLLLATAPCQEEAEFYRARLSEYRWTLTVSAKNAGFLNFAIESLESSTDLLKALPLKPKIEELDLRQIPTPQLPIPFLIPPQEADEDGSDVDDIMTDVVGVEPIHSSNFQNHDDFGASYSGWGGQPMSPVTEDTEAPFFLQTNNPNASGPFAGTAFEDLTARNWFDISHHGSPEMDEGFYT